MLGRLALAMLVALAFSVPTMARAQTTAELIFANLDAFWAAQFAERGIPYGSPTLKIVDAPCTEFCAGLDVFYAVAGYCSTNSTVTISSGIVNPDAVNVVLTLLSHEFGHHIQNLTDTGISSAFESEHQADCFVGAFIASATEADWVTPVIGAPALQLTQSAGDVWWMVPYDEAIHGTQTDRAQAFLTGQNGGLAACGV